MLTVCENSVTNLIVLNLVCSLTDGNACAYGVGKYEYIYASTKTKFVACFLN